MPLYVADIIYPSLNSTTSIAVDLFFSGCTIRCPGCHNPELWDRYGGDKLEALHIFKRILKMENASAVSLMGGEASLQSNEDMETLLYLLRSAKKYQIWLYSGLEFEDIPQIYKYYCDYIKTGPYQKDNLGSSAPIGMPVLSSKNQLFWKKENGIWSRVN